MTSPYKPNIELIFKIPTSTITIDAETGNEVTGFTITTVIANLKGGINTGTQSGNNTFSGAITGRLIKPKLMPIGISENAIADATYTDPVTKQKWIGKFFMAPNFSAMRPNAARAIARAIGYEITGNLELYREL